MPYSGHCEGHGLPLDPDGLCSECRADREHEFLELMEQLEEEYCDEDENPCDCGECWGCKGYHGDEDPRWCHEGERTVHKLRKRYFL